MLLTACSGEHAFQEFPVPITQQDLAAHLALIFSTGTPVQRIWLRGSKADPRMVGASILWSRTADDDDEDFQWPSPDALAQEAWGQVEDHGAERWKKTQVRAAFTGGGEAPSKSWTGPGVEDEDEEPQSQAKPAALAPAYPDDPVASLSVAQADIIRSVGLFAREIGTFAAIQSKAIAQRDDQIGRLTKSIERALVERQGLQTEVAEAQAQAIVATEGQAQVQADLEEAKSFQTMLGSLGVAAGTQLAGVLLDPEKTGAVTLRKVAEDDELLKKLLKSKDGEKLKAKLMDLIAKGEL